MEVTLLLVEEPMEEPKEFLSLVHLLNKINKSRIALWGLHDENDATEKSHDDSSLKDNGTAVNTATPEINN
ncbi:hypothetical protein Tco_0842272 [Tanacetum coccineum]|uniref:Uncharacterized protein n=1 Tax=Tanacetum coccineum TaxID=301880 RepID=A0ABQ5AZD2_9ASTR